MTVISWLVFVMVCAALVALGFRDKAKALKKTALPDDQDGSDRKLPVKPAAK